MKYLVFFAIILLFCVSIFCPNRNYVTTIHFKQTFSSGYVDSAVAVINTKDSAIFEICYEPPQRHFPTGGFYIAAYKGDAPFERYYALPQVIKIEPYLITSYRK